MTMICNLYHYLAWWQWSVICITILHDDIYMTGLGLGIIYLPRLDCITQYFDKKRPFVTGHHCNHDDHLLCHPLLIIDISSWPSRWSQSWSSTTYPPFITQYFDKKRPFVTGHHCDHNDYTLKSCSWPLSWWSESWSPPIIHTSSHILTLSYL